MKTAIYRGKRKISVEETAVPDIGEYDVLVQNLRAGICGTDINIVKEGSENGINFGSEFGHEMVSRIVKKGAGVSHEIKLGMIVGINPITAKKAGRSKSLECGGFSQFMKVEDAHLNFNLYEIDDRVALETAALLEPMSVGRHGAFRTDPKPDDHVVILGAGPIGLGAAASLIAEGIENVCVADRDPWRLGIAAKLGAKILDTSSINLKKGLSAIFGEIDVYSDKVPNVDIFIDAAGSAPLFLEVFKIAKMNAKLSLIAVYKDDVPISFLQMMSKEITIIGSSGYTDADLQAVVGYINNNTTKIDLIISSIYMLDDIQYAFESAIDAKNVIKIIIDLE